LRQRRISRWLLPRAIRRLVEALVGPWWTWRTITAVMGPIPGFGESGRGQDGEELAQFGLQLVGVLAGGQDPLSGPSKRPPGGPVLHRIAREATSPAQARSWWRRGPPRRRSRSGSGVVMIRALSWRRVSAGGQDGGLGGVQDPQGLWVPTLAGAGEVVAGQGLAAGLDRVQHIALGVVAAAVGVDPDDGVSLARQRGVGSRSLPAPACQHPDQAPQGSITARTTANVKSTRSSGKVAGCTCASAPAATSAARLT
jgi:hypothetical protein